MEKAVKAEFYEFATSAFAETVNKDLITKFLTTHAYKWWFKLSAKTYHGWMQVKVTED